MVEKVVGYVKSLPNGSDVMQSEEALSAKLTRVTAFNRGLLQLAQLAHLKSDVSQALLLVLEILLDFSGFDGAEIYLYEEAAETLHGVWALDCSKVSKKITRTTIPIDQVLETALPHAERLQKKYRLHAISTLEGTAELSHPHWAEATLLMVIADDLVGCIKVHNRLTAREIDESEIIELVPFAAQAALVTSHATVHADHDSNIRRLMRMLDVMPTIADNNESSDMIYRTVRDAIAETCGFDRACFFAVRGTVAYGTWGTDESGNLRDEHEVQFPLHMDERYILPPSLGGSRFIIDTLRAELPVGEFAEIPHAYIPLWSDTELIGLVAVDNLLTMRAITPAMMAPVLAICDQAAVALQKSQLLAQQQTIVREQRRLMEIAVAVTSNVDPDSIFRMIRDAILETGLVDRVGVFLVEGESAYGTWGTGPDGKVRDEHDYFFEITELKERYGSCFAGEVPFVVDGTRKGRIDSDEIETIVSYGMIPMRAGNEMIGLVTVDMLLSLRPLPAENLELILPLVRQASIVVQNNRLMKSAEIELERRRAAEEMLRTQTQELTVARDEAVSAAKVKSEFLANMSHEIRTPMNGIIGLTSILLQSRLTTDQQEYAKSVQRSAEALLTIIDDILDISRLEARMLKIHAHPFNLRDCLEDVAEMMSAQSYEKEVCLNCYVPVRFPEWLIGDSDRIRQMVTNLMANALKFTSAGEVNLEATCLFESEAETKIRISVTDTGVGIPEDQFERVFNSFTQVDTSLTRQHGGTGLGLTITKQLAELMGGAVGLQSIVGTGSTFWIDLPLSKQVPPQSLSERPRDIDKTSMLVLSSNRTKLGIISAYATAWGCAVSTFEATDRAVSYLSTASNFPDFDIVIIDSQLEDVHFSTALTEIRKSRFCEKSSALLLVPHLGQEPAHVEKHIEFSGVLVNPIRLSQFRSAMKRAVLGSRAEADPGIAQTSGTTNLGLKVLLAEDNLVNAFVASRRLEDWQCTVTLAENGADALTAVESESFDVVLMDISMPVMDGLQATKEIRQREESTGIHIPIIAITAYALKGDRERCLGAGMDDYMAKPINFNELLEKLRYWAYHS